jgi:hypothetical protein
MGYDPNSHVTFVTWTNLPISVDGKWTSMALVLKIWDQIYAVSPLTAFPTPDPLPLASGYTCSRHGRRYRAIAQDIKRIS